MGETPTKRFARWGRTTLLALALAVPIGAAVADECPGAKTQFDLDECEAKAFATADAALNLTYRNVVARAKGDGEMVKLLVDAERAWLAYRDAECAFEASGSRGGSIYPMVVSQCRARLTQARTGALRSLLTCEEGDAACPLPPR